MKYKNNKYLKEILGDTKNLEKLAILQEKLSYKFINIQLLVEALTHPSIKHMKNFKKNFDYQRLEFLGDSILGFVISELIFSKYEKFQEGKLSTIRSKLVCKEALCRASEKLNLSEYIFMSFGEENSGGRSNESNIENCFESIIAAIYIDGGLENVRKIVHIFWADLLNDDSTFIQDSKSMLQEYVQSIGKPIPIYTIINNKGSSHEPIFEVQLKVEGFESLIASGRNKKEAEKNAANEFLKLYKKL